MPEFGMSDSSYFDAPDVSLENAAFPHLTGVEWNALNRLAAISGEEFVVSLLKSATPDGQRLAIHDYGSQARRIQSARFNSLAYFTERCREDGDLRLIWRRKITLVVVALVPRG